MNYMPINMFLLKGPQYTSSKMIFNWYKFPLNSSTVVWLICFVTRIRIKQCIWSVTSTLPFESFSVGDYLFSIIFLSSLYLFKHSLHIQCFLLLSTGTNSKISLGNSSFSHQQFPCSRSPIIHSFSFPQIGQYLLVNFTPP